MAHPHQQDPATLSRWLKQTAAEQGWDLCGICTLSETPHWQNYQEWLQAGYQADMRYLENHLEARRDLRTRFPEATFLVCLGISYDPALQSSRAQHSEWQNAFRVARYATGKDYHIVLRNKLQRLVDHLTASIEQPNLFFKLYTDTGPLAERSFGAAAGLGWIAKNAMLISSRIGSYFFLAELITNLPLQADAPSADHCGTCTRCIEACPTDAIVRPGVVNSNDCIAYLTIETRGELAESDRTRIGHHLFGCDICQEVCPWNGKAPPLSEPAFKPLESHTQLTLAQLIVLDEQDYRTHFKDSAMERAKRQGLRRNAILVAANTHRTDLLPLIRSLQGDSDPVIANTAAWAASKLSS